MQKKTPRGSSDPGGLRRDTHQGSSLNIYGLTIHLKGLRDAG